MILIPLLASLGKSPYSFPKTSPLTLKILGIEGPVISASKIPISKPSRRSPVASKLVTRDLPTPPLPLTTPITFLILEYLLGFSLKSLISHFSLQLAQSLLQAIVFSFYNIFFNIFIFCHSININIMKRSII